MKHKAMLEIDFKDFEVVSRGNEDNDEELL
jgi:hypothetical protein